MLEAVELPKNMCLGARLTMTVAEALRVQGFHDVRATAPGFKPPRLIAARHQPHRPDISAIFNNGKLLLVDTLDPAQSDEVTRSRWELFQSAVSAGGGQFHVIVPSMVDKEPGSAFVKKKQAKFKTVTKIDKVWEV